MDSFKIECFLTLAELKNFTKTGERLHISQPAVSKNIASLEQELGLTLIDRGAYRPKLTPAGEHMAECFRALQAEFQLRLRESLLMSGAAYSSLKIGLLTGTGSKELSEALLHFQERYPHFSFSIDTHSVHNILTGLKEGSFDLAATIDFGFSDDPDFDCVHLTTGQYILLYSSALSSIPENPVLSDFRDAPFLLSRGSDKGYMEEILLQLCKAHHFEPKTKALTSSLESAFNMVDSNIGVILISDISLSDSLRSRPSLRWLDTGIPCSYVAVWKKENKNPLIPAFIDLLQSAEEQPAPPESAPSP